MSEERDYIIRQLQRYKDVYIELKFGEPWRYKKRKKKLEYEEERN